MKIGRNDPCFCGSGRKYKKCCFGKSDQVAPSLEKDDGTIDQYPNGVHPLHMVRTCTNPEILRQANLTKREIKRLMERWTPAKMKQFETEEIVQRLSEFGVNAKKDAFIALADGYISAWKLATYWLDNDVDYLPTTGDEDYVCFAACELWERYLPERPSAEMVDDWVHEAYDLEEEGKQEDACELYQRVWKRMLELITPEMKTYSSVDPIFNISQCFSNWIQDFELCLDELIMGDNSWLKLGISFAKRSIKQFSDEEMVFVRCCLGRWLIQDGRAEEGIAVLEEMIALYPERVDGYVNLTHARTPSGEQFLDAEKAIEALERAKAACPQREIDAWDIEQRIADLKEEAVKY